MNLKPASVRPIIVSSSHRRWDLVNHLFFSGFEIVILRTFVVSTFHTKLFLYFKFLNFITLKIRTPDLGGNSADLLIGLRTADCWDHLLESRLTHGCWFYTVHCVLCIRGADQRTTGYVCVCARACVRACLSNCMWYWTHKYMSPLNDVSVNDGPCIRQWSHKIIL
jgi:hypothetical protein